jgi:hypothetical protein
MIVLIPRELAAGAPRNRGCLHGLGILAPVLRTGGGVAWIMRLVKTGAEGEDPGTDLIEIRRPNGLGDIADLGLICPARSCC